MTARGKLTRTELSREIARRCGTTVKEGKELLEAVLSAMVRSVARGERVEIRGFGSFGTRVHRARTGKNPKTGEAVEVRARRVAYFRAAKPLRLMR